VADLRLNLVSSSVAVCILSLLAATPALSLDTWWSDEIIRLLSIHQAERTGEDIGPYLRKMQEVRRALIRNDDRTVQSELNTLFQMVRQRSFGLTESTAREFFNVLVVLTPLREYGITVPDPELDRQ
jgi:hypothetical protein